MLSPVSSILLDLKAHRHAAEALAETAPLACARHGGAEAIIAGGRPVVSGGGFWSWTADDEAWQDLAAEAQARYRGNTGEAIDTGLSIGRVPRK